MENYERIQFSSARSGTFAKNIEENRKIFAATANGKSRTKHNIMMTEKNLATVSPKNIRTHGTPNINQKKKMKKTKIETAISRKL